MIKAGKSFLADKLITHGWQVPVRLLVWWENLTNSYSYMSQEGQDQLVLGLLNQKSNGVFVEIGGSNGVTSSNSYVLEKKYGWSGLCIEANKRFYNHLIKNRNCKTVNCVAADIEKDVFFNNDGATGSIDKSGEEMHAKPLAQILTEQNMPEVIDYLSLDVEGFEEDVLYNFPFDKFKFRIMSIERPSDKLHQKVLDVGYEMHMKIGEGDEWLDNIYIFPSLIEN